MVSDSNLELAVVMPVYNEEEALPGVIREWAGVLASLQGARLIVWNDGSRDGTGAILDRLAAEFSHLEVKHKQNSGHGRTCIEAYRDAVARGFRYVFQTDSDGQTRASEFLSLWDSRTDEDPFIFGYRPVRGDGRMRFFITRILSFSLRLLTGFSIRDPNVPFRLMRSRELSALVCDFPPEVDLANVLLTVRILKRGYAIRWVPVTFSPRRGGAASVRLGGFVVKGARLLAALLNLRLKDRL